MTQSSTQDPTLDFTSVGPQSLAGAYLRRFWQPVYLSRNLKLNRAVPLKILGDEFTLYRDAAGVAHVVGAFCPHRNTRLSIGIVDGESIRCFYHGWKFHHSGKCTEQPAEDGFVGSHSIESYPTFEYIGLVFCYFGPGDPPERPRFDVFASDAYIDVDESIRNWTFFDQLENSVDEVHFNFVHRRSKFTDVGLNREIPRLSAEETEYGILRIGRRGDKVRHSHILMPNCMYSMVFEPYKGWVEHLAWRVPIDENTHVSFMVEAIHLSGSDLDKCLETIEKNHHTLSDLPSAEEMIKKCLNGELHVDEIEGRPDIVLLQDGVAMGALRRPRDRSQDFLTSSDRQVSLLRRLWRRELSLLNDNQAIKIWRVPPELVPTSGT